MWLWDSTLRVRVSTEALVVISLRHNRIDHVLYEIRAELAKLLVMLVGTLIRRQLVLIAGALLN